jgi:hypothetical protein
MHGLVAKSLADVDISERKQKWSCCKHRRETAMYDLAEAQWKISFAYAMRPMATLPNESTRNRGAYTVRYSRACGIICGFSSAETADF